MPKTTRKKIIEVIDMTPTWTVAAQIISMTITSGSEEGRSVAAEEVERMGSIIDALKAEVDENNNRIKQLTETIKDVSHNIAVGNYPS
jgi:peptidoglycan hydrolase CwlO-like protein